MRRLITAQFIIAVFLNIIATFAFVGCSKKATVIPDISTFEKAPARSVEPRQDAVVFDFPEERQMPPQPEFVVVRFKYDSDELTQEYKDLIDLLDVSGRHVELVGGACPIGPTEYNHVLGMRRALAVYNYIARNGIVDISWRSVGETQLVSDDPDKYYLNRRCEINLGK